MESKRLFTNRWINALQRGFSPRNRFHCRSRNQVVHGRFPDNASLWNDSTFAIAQYFMKHFAQKPYPSDREHLHSKDCMRVIYGALDIFESVKYTGGTRKGSRSIIIIVMCSPSSLTSLIVKPCRASFRTTAARGS